MDQIELTFGEDVCDIVVNCSPLLVGPVCLSEGGQSRPLGINCCNCSWGKRLHCMVVPWWWFAFHQDEAMRWVGKVPCLVDVPAW